MTRALGLIVWLGGCAGALPGPDPLLAGDGDGDGWSVGDGDCDDTDPDIHPLALDVPLDDIDQDCTGDDAAGLPVRSLGPGDLVISEILVDPVGVDDALGEWFELRNPGDLPIDLDGLVVRDLGNDDFVVAQPVLVEPGGHVVLGAWADPVVNGGVEPDYRYDADFGLSNDEDAIRVFAGMVLVDEVLYDPRWPLEAGVALALGPDDDAVDNDAFEAWCEATETYGLGGLGTPGEANDDCGPPFVGLTLVDLQPGDLVITEVMQNPAQADDDFGEWVEILNATASDIQLRGLEVTDEDDDGFVIDTPTVVAAGGLLLLGSSSDRSRNGDAPVDLAWGFGYGLANSGQQIALLAGTRLIDQITYDNGATFPDPNGASMRLDPGAHDADANDDGGQWCEGITPYGDGDLGTPGAPNPPC